MVNILDFTETSLREASRLDFIEGRSKLECYVVLFILFFFRKYDYENFLTTLLYPKSYRSAAFAIRSLNVEIAQVSAFLTHGIKVHS